MSDIKLTGRQRSMLCWLASTDGVPPREGLMASNPSLAHELIESLQTLGLLMEPAWVDHDWVRRPTEDGMELANRTRYSSTGCQACVRVHCVCNVSLVCVAHCGSAGCHGSHD